MLKNYFKIAIRNLMKNKVFSFINIFGLSIGLTCCMLIALYIVHELSYDSYHKNVDRLYQLGTTFIISGEQHRTANTPAPMANAVQQEFPEIEKTTRLLSTFLDDEVLLRYTSSENKIKSFYESKAFLADSTFFQLFSYNFKEGNPLTALSNPNSVVLSEEIAKKLFGNEPALNKIVHISCNTNGENDFIVTGVFIPSKIPSHIDARLFMSFRGGGIENFIKRRGNDLASNNIFYTYLLLKKGADPKELEAKFPAFIDKYAGNELKSMGFYKEQFLIPVKDIHLYSNTKGNVTLTENVSYLYILISIAFFTLLIAVINFMNLSTARSSKRSAEVGVRKVLGAEKRSLIGLFLGESLMLAIIAFFFAICITEMLLPIFSELSGKVISFSFGQFNMGLLILSGFFLFSILTGLLAGSYPAFYLSSFNPVKVLKGKSSNSLAAASLRKGLVVFQFVISVVLVISTLVINNQLNYMQSKALGFDKDQQIVIPLHSTTAKNIVPSFKAELSHMSQIQSVGASYYYPGIFNPSDMPFYKENSTVNDPKRFFMNWIDNSFLQTLNIKPVAGRLFSKEFPADTNYRIIINEAGVKKLGFQTADKAVGSDVFVDYQGKTYKWEVIGVVKDFNFKGLQEAIEPYGFLLSAGSQFNYMIAHAKTGKIKETLESIKRIWQKLNPAEPFEYSFLDQDFQRNYESETQLSEIVKYFTLIAILISCLGLFGLATFSAERRTKEIGVRKVLGASVGNIVSLLSKDFLKLVLLAAIISTPLAWYIMNKWLQDFAYHIEISIWVLLVAWVIAILIAFVTVSFQAFRAASANPVTSLKYE